MRVRVRVVLAVGLALIAAGLVLDISRAAPRTAGTDRTGAAAFVVTLDGAEMCQRAMILPPHSGSIRVLVGSYGRPVPALRARFLNAGGAEVAAGSLAAGAREGAVSIPLASRRPQAVAGTLCIAPGAREKVSIAGEPFPVSPDAASVSGVPQPGRISVVYERPGSESWWSLLPTLSERFGLGKATLFGDWTLAVAALALLGVWVATVRLLLRELRP